MSETPTERIYKRKFKYRRQRNLTSHEDFKTSPLEEPSKNIDKEVFKTKGIPTSPLIEEKDKNEDPLRNAILIAASLILLVLMAYFALKPIKKANSSIPLESPFKKKIENHKNNYPIIANKVRCPVCKKKFNSNRAEFEHRIKGSNTPLYFDTEKCYRKFLDNPQKYVEMNLQYKIKVKIKESPVKSSPIPKSVLDTEIPKPEILKDPVESPTQKQETLKIESIEIEPEKKESKDKIIEYKNSTPTPTPSKTPEKKEEEKEDEDILIEVTPIEVP